MQSEHDSREKKIGTRDDVVEAAAVHHAANHDVDAADGTLGAKATACAGRQCHPAAVDKVRLSSFIVRSMIIVFIPRKRSRFSVRTQGCMHLAGYFNRPKNTAAH